MKNQLKKVAFQIVMGDNDFELITRFVPLYWRRPGRARNRRLRAGKGQSSMTERAIAFSGTGAQGIQLAAKTLAVAAMHEQRQVMVCGTYGGTMRGGYTESTIIVADQPVLSPPTVDAAWAALVMHHQGWPAVRRLLKPGALVLLDSSVFRGEHEGLGANVVEITATEFATDRGQPRTAAMICLGAFCALTSVVRLDSLLEAAKGVLPSYRAQHAAANVEALKFGFGLFPAARVPAWTPSLEAA